MTGPEQTDRHAVENEELSPVQAGDPDVAKWRAELALFQSIENELAKDEGYAGKYVAFKDGRVIDSDVDEFRLARRIGEGYPGDVVLIAEVGAGIPDVTLELPSVELRE